MKWRRRLLMGIAILYGLGLVWGYFRLPWAAVKSLGNVSRAAAVNYVFMSMSSSQRWYLDQALQESPVPVRPQVSVEIKWYAVVLARVRTSYYVSPKGAADRDSLFLCVFGAWLPVHNFGHTVAERPHSGEAVVNAAFPPALDNHRRQQWCRKRGAGVWTGGIGGNWNLAIRNRG